MFYLGMNLLTPKEALDYAQWDCLAKKNMMEKNIHPDREQNLLAILKILKSGLQQLLSLWKQKDGESIELE